MAKSQYYTQNDRLGLYDPISHYFYQDYDPLHPYSRQQAMERRARPFRFGNDPSNLNGTGPSLYYGRAAAYIRGLGLDQAGGRNANVYTRGGGSRPRGNHTGRGVGGGGGSGQGGWAAGSPAAWMAGWAAGWVERVACYNPTSGVVPHLFLIKYDEIAVRNSRVGAAYGYRDGNRDGDGNRGRKPGRGRY